MGIPEPLLPTDRDVPGSWPSAARPRAPGEVRNPSVARACCPARSPAPGDGMSGVIAVAGAAVAAWAILIVVLATRLEVPSVF